jgi:hypothetical protein
MSHSNKLNIIIIFALLYLSLIIGFLFDENSSGGAFTDFNLRISIINQFITDFKFAFFNYDTLGDRHSPVLPIIIYYLLQLGLELSEIRFLHLHLLLLIIFFSYKCLITKFSNVEKKILFLISCVFFISPIMRSTAIWPDSRILGLLLFIISLFFFLKFKKKKKLSHCIYSNIILVLSSYISPNFSVFFIFFFYHYFLFYKFSNKIFLIIIVNFLFSVPMFIYLFILQINFLIIPVDGSVANSSVRLNLSNKILIISTLVSFYLIPIIMSTNFKKNFFEFFQVKYLLYTFVLTTILILFFNYQINFTGGGIVFKLSHILFKNSYLFYLFSLFSLIMIITFFKINANNLLLFIILIISNPQLTIYHKYYDPLLILLFLLSFEFKFNIVEYLNKKLLIYIYIFYTLFLGANFLRYLI